MVGFEYKNDTKKDMCWKEIELGAQNLLNILDIIVNIISGGWESIWSFNTF